LGNEHGEKWEHSLAVQKQGKEGLKKNGGNLKLTLRKIQRNVGRGQLPFSPPKGKVRERARRRPGRKFHSFTLCADRISKSEKKSLVKEIFMVDASKEIEKKKIVQNRANNVWVWKSLRNWGGGLRKWSKAKRKIFKRTM